MVAAIALGICGLSLGLSGCGGRQSLQGAGASFPAPLYMKWFKEWGTANGVTVEYQSIGSGGGIKALQDGTVDFGASDAAMDDEEIASVERGVQLLPMTAGAIVLAYNIPDGPEELKLSRETYTGIFLGKIKNWNDPAIAADNEGATLPDQEITIIRRADSSGTTYNFTKHLSEVSQEWADGPGTGKTVEWPSEAKYLGAKGNEGISQQLQDTPGTLGYIEFGYAEQNDIPMATLENQSGNFIKPSTESAAAALAAVELPENLRVFLPDPEGDNSYPIVTYTWILAYKKYDDPQKLAALKKLLTWCLTEGQQQSAEMGYIPLPEEVTSVVLEALDNITAG